MNTVNLVIKKNYQRKDGTTPIYLQYNYTRSKRRLFKTGKFVSPNEWDANRSKIRKQHAQANEWNEVVYGLKHKLERIIDEAKLNGIHATVDFVQNSFESSTGVDNKKDYEFWSMFEAFIESKKGHVSVDTIKDYNSLKKHLTSYEKKARIKMDVSIIDFNFYNKFLFHLENEVVKPNGDKGLQKNSAGKQIKNLKAFLHYAMNSGLIPHIDLSGFKVISIESANIFLTEHELDKLLELDISNDLRLKRIRDIFIIGCETGLRYGDLKRLNWNHFDEDRKFIRTMVSKTLGKVVIPVSVRLTKVLIDYEEPDFPCGIHANDINREIKILAKRAGITSSFSRWQVTGTSKTEITLPKYEFISTHTCRRTFCTNQYELGVPTYCIMKISGHKTEKAFLKYVKITEESAAKKMAEIWANRKKRSE
jgi:integrase